MSSDLRTCYLYHRRAGLAKGWNCLPLPALRKAREDVAAGKDRYLDGKDGWNPASPEGTRYVDDLKAAGLRAVGYADELVRIGHEGHAADDIGDEYYRGVVLQLPGTGRSARYLAAYADPENTGAFIVDCSDIFLGEAGEQHDDDAKRETARAADAFAEKHAAKEREYQDAFSRGSEYASLLQTAADARSARRQLARDLAKAKRDAAAAGVSVPASVCSVLRERMSAYVAVAKDAADKASEVLNDMSRRRPLADAFNQGAGEEVIKP